MKQFIVFLFAFSLISTQAQAQFFKKIMDGATDKVMDKVEDRIIDELTEELARQMYKPIDKALDSLMYREYEESGQNDSIDYTGFLKMLNSNAELPPNYNFDVSLDIEVKDYDGDKHDMEMMFSKSGDHFGFKQLDKKEDAFNFMIIDYKNDLMCMYSEKDGKKTVQAIPSMMGLATHMAKQQIDTEDYKVNETGKTKKIAGYKCSEFEIETTDEISKVYVSKEFPINWEESFGQQMSQLNSESYAKIAKVIDGMVLQSESKQKDNKKKKSSWKTKKVRTDSFLINNSEYKKESLTAN